MPKMLTESQRCQEKTYWTHLKNQKFVKIFKSEYDHRLLLPQKFVGSLNTSFDAVVKVQDPSKVIWEFGLTRRSNAYYFDHGWKKFVRAHSLQENDVLVFTYIGQMWFDILIFENQALCERVSSYFVDGLNIDDEENISEQSSNSEYLKSSPNELVICGSDPLRLKMFGGKPVTEAAGEQQSCLGRRNKKLKETEEPMPSSSAGVLVKSKQYHKEALVTELQKQKALQLAYASARGIWSVYTMRKSYISQGFSMTLATKWAKQYLPAHSQDIILRTKGESWDVRFNRKGTGYALTGGWKKFAVDNDLQEDDVCSFYLDTSESKTLTLDVEIFRPQEIQIPESAISETTLIHTNQALGQKRKSAKLLAEDDYESL